MAHLLEIQVRPEPLDRYTMIVGDEVMKQLQAQVVQLRTQLEGRSVWNINSTVMGGGVAELLRTLVPFARGTGIDARWLVIRGTPEFFTITKRIHNALHGEAGDGSPLGDAERSVYEGVSRENLHQLLAVVRPRDVVILHDPQTAGLAPCLLHHGARVIWRCHVGSDGWNDQNALGWAFLERYLRNVDAYIFTREAYIPPMLDPSRCEVIAPSLDPFSPKNQPMEPEVQRAILAHVGLIEGPSGPAQPVFRRDDGSPGRVDHAADLVRLGPAPCWDTPLVVQVSRWDALKDPVGVVRGFARRPVVGPNDRAALLVVGPNVNGVADDPDGAQVFDQVFTTWRALPHHARRQIHLVCLPSTDVEENAAIVNAIQRHATIVVQKSIKEGFGLTVTEAMWKSRPIVATAVGGIQDQIQDGVDGLLLRDPRDLDEFAAAVDKLLADPALAKRLGEHAFERTREQFLGTRTLLDYAELIARVDAHGDAMERARSHAAAE
jgi:trehalose synthase